MTTRASIANLGLTEAELASISPEAMAAKVAQIQRAMWRWLPLLGMFGVLALALFAPNAMAEGASTSTSYGGINNASDKLSGFLKGVKKILGPLSVLVVTVAFIFAGYQIAFNHKRISDVAPVLIGAIIIGASAQLAKMFIDQDEFSKD